MSTRTRNGYTLIEVLVVIGVIGILIAIAIPALSGARGSALQTVSLSNVRSVGQQMEEYASVHRQYAHRGLGDVPADLPQIDGFDFPNDVLIVSWYPGGVVMATSDYFSQAWLWPAIVTPMLEWPEYWSTWISPRKQDADLPKLADFGFGDEGPPIEEVISVRYSNSFVAAPSYFSGRQQAPDRESSFRAVKPHEVRYASQKVMLWDNDLAYITRDVPERIDGLLDAQTPMCFADGHGEVLNPQDASEPVENPRMERVMRLHATLNGVHGRDY